MRPAKGKPAPTPRLLLFFGVVVIGLTLVFTLSRAGVASAFLVSLWMSVYVYQGCIW